MWSVCRSGRGVLRQLARERCECPVVAVRVGHGEVAGRVVGLVGELVHDRCFQCVSACHHCVRVCCDNVQRTGAGSARCRPLACTGHEHSPTLWSVELTVMDPSLLVTWDQQVAGESQRKEPPAERRSVIADNTGPYARLPDTADANGHDSNDSREDGGRERPNDRSGRDSMADSITQIDGSARADRGGSCTSQRLQGGRAACSGGSGRPVTRMDSRRNRDREESVRPVARDAGAHRWHPLYGTPPRSGKPSIEVVAGRPAWV